MPSCAGRHLISTGMPSAPSFEAAGRSQHHARVTAHAPTPTAPRVCKAEGGVAPLRRHSARRSSSSGFGSRVVYGNCSTCSPLRRRAYGTYVHTCFLPRSVGAVLHGGRRESEREREREREDGNTAPIPAETFLRAAGREINTYLCIYK